MSIGEPEDETTGRSAKDPIIALVVAASSNGVIGMDGAMPWKMPSDLRYFKALTLGKPIVMGRKTFESIGRPLPGRPNIVISRRTGFAPSGVEVVSTLDDGLERGRRLARDLDVGEIMVVGGGQIYAQSLKHAQRIYLTEILVEVEGDTRFVEIDSADWEEVSREHHEAGENDSADFAFVVLERRTSV